MTLRTTLSRTLDTPWGDRLRAWSGLRPPNFLRPLRGRDSVSDLALWRSGTDWQTRFDLFNLPSLSYPAQALVDEATLVLFDCGGRELFRRKFTLQPFETRPVLFAEMLSGRSGMGTFACFHQNVGVAGAPAQGSHFYDRQYTAFRRRDGDLWGFVHGNISAVSSTSSSPVASLARTAALPGLYRLQCRFDDCESAELIYANYSRRAQPLRVRFLDENRKETGVQVLEISAFGCGTIAIPRHDSKAIMVEQESRLAFWRPVVFKHYPSHFDVFHG